MIRDPLVIVLLYSSLAALAAVAGVLPQAIRGRPTPAAIGWAYALAAGLMFGVVYTLLNAGLREGLIPGGLGALLGIAFVRASHALAGTGVIDVADPDAADPEAGYREILRDTLHSAHEGIAIGVAMLLSIPLGIAMALALAVHNVPEAMVLTAVLNRKRVTVAQSAGLALASNVNQVLLAVVTFTAGRAAPALVPWATGFAVGALMYLVLAELLPESYRQAGPTSIALVTMAAMGALVLLTGGAW